MQIHRQLNQEEIYTLLTPEGRRKRQNIERELNKVHELFLSVGLTEEAKEVQKELDSL